MKTIIKITLGMIMLVILASCSSQTKDLVLTSPEKNITITFKATQPTSLDPWDVKMDISGYGKERSITFDMYNSTFDTETVMVDWKDENSCVLTCKQSDGDNRVMDIYLSAEEIRLQER